MSSDTTAERIIASALASLLHKGVQKTTLADVAFQAGITRVTIYRYFGDKQSLVRAVCLRIAAIFQRAAQAGPEDTTDDINRRLSQMGDELGALPKGNLLGLFEEIHRRYPEVHEEFRRAREEAVDSIFQQALGRGEPRRGSARGAPFGSAQSDLLGGGGQPFGEPGATLLERFVAGDLYHGHRSVSPWHPERAVGRSSV